MMKLCIAAACLVALVNSIPIDNGVQGEPEIECGPTSISVTFNTQNPFSGHVYVKNLYDQDAAGCRTTGDGSRSIGQIELPHFVDDCNVERTRSLNPKGVFVRSTIVISFHPNFLTKIDRAYTIQCFYMEADKTVSTDIEVSMITTGFQTQFVPMPVCRYEILDSPSGNVVQFAEIGMPVVHKWTCDTDTVDTFCMTVHSCFVDDGAGDRLDLIQPDGCAVDKYLMGNVEYPTDLMGQREVHVFKYADRPALQFQCQITILVKEPNGECERPQCAEPAGRGDGQARRFARQVIEQPQAAGTLDVAAQVDTLDINVAGRNSAHHAFPSSFYDRPVLMKEVRSSVDGVCLSSTTAYSLVFVVALCLAAALTAAVTVHCQRRK